LTVVEDVGANLAVAGRLERRCPMKTTTTERWKRWARGAVGVAVILMATAAAAPVLAHGARHHRDHPRHDRGHRVDRPARHVRHVRHVVVPQRIRMREVRIYRPYYRGSVYHPRHRHVHEVYYFPVRTPYGVVHLPHDYCDGRLFVGGHVAYRGDRFGFAFGF
jgi:hypothetical protein